MIYDFAVIGGGSAGLSIAAAAAQFGENVVLFEKGEMGGDCLNSGCVPSKSLIAAAKYAQAQRTSEKFGVKSLEPTVSYAKVMDYVGQVITTIAPVDSQARFEGLGVKVVRAHARFTGKTTLEADGKSYKARRIVIATGSRPALPAIRGLSDVLYFTNETIFKNRVMPRHLLIIGGGPIGMEMAQAHVRLGSRVTVFQSGKALPKDDPELAEVVVSALRLEGVDIRTNVEIVEVKSIKGTVSVSLKNGDVIKGSHLLVAAGRMPNIENLNLEAAKINSDSHGLVVDRQLRTSNRKVYAAGDVAGGLQFTHVASYHAGLVIRNAMFRLPVRNRTDVIPWVTFTDPELAHVGLNEIEARQLHGDKIKILRWYFKENDRAQTEDKIKGLVKIIISKNGRILGAGIVGSGAGELIAPWILAVTKGLKISSIANLVLPYPTFSEAGKRAAVANYAALAKNRWLRGALGILKLLG